MDSEKVSRETLPTASFSLTVSIISWLEEEAKRRGIKKSVLVREILDAARNAEREPVAA
jgi:hypothetical protein